MKCYQHYERDVVSQCVDCGRGLCPECTEKWAFPICDDCNYKRASADKRQVVKNIALTIVLFVLGFSVSAQVPFIIKLLVGYIFAGIPWGWGVLNRITPNIFLFLPIVGWIFYFIIKLGIAATIGEFVLPYKIFMFVKNYKKVKNIQEQIKSTVS